MNGGAIEHAFCLANAIRTAAALVKEGGWLFSSSPANNRMDHGFYQVSPTLMFDFLSVNGFEFGTSHASVRRDEIWRSYPLYLGEGQAFNNRAGRINHTIRARKVAGATHDRIPLQSVYA